MVGYFPLNGQGIQIYPSNLCRSGNHQVVLTDRRRHYCKIGEAVAPNHCHVLRPPPLNFVAIESDQGPAVLRYSHSMAGGGEDAEDAKDEVTAAHFLISTRHRSNYPEVRVEFHQPSR